MPRRKMENRTIEVILLQQDKYLGEKYQVVRVKPIFARNVLFPQGIAVLADKANLNKYEQKMAAAQKDLEKKAANLEELLMKVQQDDGISLTRKANKEGVLYAQISDEDIAAAISEKYKLNVEPHYFKIKKKIKMVGDYMVPFIFQDVKKDIKLTVASDKSEEEKEAKKEEVVSEETSEETPAEEK